MIRHFTLPPDQVSRAIAAGGPLQDLQVDPAKLSTMAVAVVEVDGEIVSYWVAWYGLHCEPIWVREDHRKSPAVIRGIVDEMEQLIKASGDQAAFCVVEAENLPVVSTYVARLGFQEAPGRLYYLVVPTVAPVEV